MGDPAKIDSCPIDHTNPEIVAKYQQIGKHIELQIRSGQQTSPASCPSESASIPPSLTEQTCPVDHAKSDDSSQFGRNQKQDLAPLDHANGGEGLPPLPNVPSSLSGEREVSSIPRAGADKNWVYPSEQQFYSAMKRKQFNPDAQDMPVIIPIHNAVNERCWQQILAWEYRQASKVCGGPQLVKFEGDSSKLTPKARLNMLLGATRPFDRHDWTVDRCGKHIDYVIDFYVGEADPRFPERQSFYLDARPKLNSWEGIKMRLQSLIWGP